MRAFLAAAAVLVLALGACGPRDANEASVPGQGAADVAPSGPVLSGTGSLSSVDGRTAVIDHAAIPGGLPAGRNEFRAYAVVLAEAPLEPGAQIAFSYQMAGETPVLTELRAAGEAPAAAAEPAAGS